MVWRVDKHIDRQKTLSERCFVAPMNWGEITVSMGLGFLFSGAIFVVDIE